MSNVARGRASWTDNVRRRTHTEGRRASQEMGDGRARRLRPRAAEDVTGEGFMVMASMRIALLAEGAASGAGEEEAAVSNSAGRARLGTRYFGGFLSGP